MRAAGRTHARLARLVAALVVAATLLGAAGAHADQTFETARDVERLGADGDRLAAESQAATLELYALESELARTQARLGELRGRAAEVERREQAARTELASVRRTLAAAEARLAERLRDLYVRDEPHPLAVLLGAESIDEAISTLDNLGRFAEQDRAVIEQVNDARRQVRAALDKLSAQSEKLEALVADAARTEAVLASARAERQSYLARLEEEKRLNAAQLARAREAAQQAEQKAAEIQASAPSQPPGASGPAPGAPPAGPGTRMTVVATAYSLPGTTSTGMPVGWGVVAVDPSVIPLGTRMTIPGYGEGIAADTGAAVRGRVIDLWFPTRKQALAWGRRTVTITLQ